jgi:hypothetical protein
MCTICNKPVHTLSRKQGMKFQKYLILLSGKEWRREVNLDHDPEGFIRQGDFGHFPNREI